MVPTHTDTNVQPFEEIIRNPDQHVWLNQLDLFCDCLIETGNRTPNCIFWRVERFFIDFVRVLRGPIVKKLLFTEPFKLKWASSLIHRIALGLFPNNACIHYIVHLLSIISCFEYLNDLHFIGLKLKVKL